MNVYLSTKVSEDKGDNIGRVLAELLRELSNVTIWNNFRNFYTLLMLYV